MDRKKFFQGVRNFSKFKHSRVSEVTVDDELICFEYTPEPTDDCPSPESINISIDLHESPNETRVFIGEKDKLFKQKYIPEIVNTLLKELEDGTILGPKISPSSSPAPPAAAAAAASFDPLFDLPAMGGSTTPAPSTGLGGIGSSELLMESGEVVFSEPFEGGVIMNDSRGQKFRATEELKNDIENFRKVYGQSAINITAFDEEVILLLDLGVDSAIGKDTMMAWGFDKEQRVYARLRTSTFYRDGAFQKVSVQQGSKPDKFAPQFQLENIVNQFLSQTWSHDSGSFVHPVTSERYISPRAGSKDKRRGFYSFSGAKPNTFDQPPPRRIESGKKKTGVSKNLRELVTMGFNIAKASKALKMSQNDLTTAVTLCCECLDSLDTSDVDQHEMEEQLCSIAKGEVDDDDESSSAPGGIPADYQPSYLVDIVQYMQSRLPSLNEFCIICDQKHPLGHMLKPTVCTRELCCWSFQELGVAAGATDFVATSQEVVDMLLLFAQEAIKSSRRNVIFDPYPLVFDPHDRKKKVFDPDNKDYYKVERILTRIPTMKSFAESGKKMTEELGKIDPFAHSLLNWVISSNRSFFVKLPDKIAIRDLHCEQFLMLSSPPDKEKVFRSLRKQYGSVYAFHGSSIENWHSIVRHGLKNASGTKLQVNGTAYGSGIYMSPYLSTAASYTRSGRGLTVIAVVEVVNNGIRKSTQSKKDDIWVVPNESYVVTRMLLLFRGGATSSYSATGEKVAPQIRNVMKEYGVAQD